jgi:hypothetical protein
MLDTLPPEVIRAIYGATNDLAAATSLARCSKYFYEIWTAHFRTLSLHDAFAHDERWGSMRYLDSARMLARIQFAKAGGSYAVIPSHSIILNEGGNYHI